MIKIEKTDILGVYAAIRGMRNPYESHEKSDSKDCGLMSCLECPLKDKNCLNFEITVDSFVIGKTDLALCKKLIKAGSEHRKFLRMIHVQFDIRMPRYFATELDTYKVGTTKNSSSTMHLITKRDLTLDDFEPVNAGVREILLDSILPAINTWIHAYNDTSDNEYKNDILRSIKQLLPESFIQMATYDMSYETLLSIYHQRKNHRLSEWHTFCDWIKSLPYMEEFLEAME